MAKKRSIGRTVIAGAGIGVLLIVIIPVMFFVFGVGNDNILPQEPDPDPFEIPITCLDGQIRTPEGTCIADIDPIIENPEMFCSADSDELLLFARCQLMTQGEIEVPEPPLGIDPNTFVNCSGIDEQTKLECIEQIDELIILLQTQPIIPVIPPNGTETSTDDAFTQLCDQNPELIVCGDSRSLELLTRVLKTDSSGVQTVVETTTGIPQLAFFVEDTSDIDFRTGQLVFEVQIKGDPNLRYMGTGKVDLLVGDQSLFLQPINVKVDGIADAEGKVDLLFITPTGTSDLILFDFEENFDKFVNEAITTVRLHVVELNIAGERDQNFALIDQDVFRMDIARDDIKLLITSEEGIVTRVYPSDSRIKLTTVASKSDPYFTGRISTVTFDSTFYGNGLGCSPPFVSSSATFEPTTKNTATVPAPSISGVSVMDADLNVITSVAGGTGIVLDFNKLTRNQNYTMKVTSPSITSSDLVYGKSQESKQFSCWQEGTVTTKTTATTYGNCSVACGGCTTSIYQVFGSLKLGAKQCNFPTENP